MKKSVKRSLRIDYVIVMLVLIVLSGFLIRFWALPSKGLTEIDEGSYLSEAAWLNGQDLMQTGYPFFTFKPAFSYFVSLSQNVFGMTDFSGHFVAAIFGTLSIILVYLIGDHLYNKRIGLISSFIFAFLPLEVIFSRKVYSETTMMFFYLLSFLIYIIASARYQKTASTQASTKESSKASSKASTKALKNSSAEKSQNLLYLLCGIFAGISYLAKFLGLSIIGLFFLMEIYLIIKRKKSLKRSALDFLFIVLGFTIVFILIWLIYHFILDVSYSYFLLQRMRQFPPTRFIIDNIPALANLPRYPSDYSAGSNIFIHFFINMFYLYKTVSIVLLPFFLLGLYALFRKRSWQDILVLISFSVLFVFVVFVAFFPRMLMFLPPFIALISARGFDFLERGILARWLRGVGSAIIPIISYVLFLMILLSSVLMLMPQLTDNFDYYRKASAYLDDLNAGNVASTDNAITSFYTKGESRSIYSFQDLTDLKQEGYTHILLNTWYLSPEAGFEEGSIMYWINEEQIPMNEIEYELESWKFPFAEIDMLDSLYRSTGISFFRSAADKARSNTLTKSPVQYLKVYSIDAIIQAYENQDPDTHGATLST